MRERLGGKRMTARIFPLGASPVTAQFRSIRETASTVAAPIGATTVREWWRPRSAGAIAETPDM
jgi:hypothetical protein